MSVVCEKSDARQRKSVLSHLFGNCVVRATHADVILTRLVMQKIKNAHSNDA